jgi:hypothetical protein
MRQAEKNNRASGRLDGERGRAAMHSGETGRPSFEPGTDEHEIKRERPTRNPDTYTVFRSRVYTPDKYAVYGR